MSSAIVKSRLLATALNTLIVVGVALLLKLGDKLIVTLEEQKQKLDEAIKKYKSAESELHDINSELETTASRIDELNSKENLTFTEQDELDRLIKINDELERKIYLLEQANNAAEKEVAEEAQITYNKYNRDRDLTATEQIDYYRSTSLLEGVDWESFKNDLPWLIAQYENQQKKLKTAQENGWSDIEAQTESNIENLKQWMSDASLEYQSLYETISGLSSYSMTDDLEVAKNDLDGILDITAKILGYTGENNTSLFDEIWNSDDFSKYKDELEELAKNGQLDSNVLESNENYRILLEKTGATAEATAEHIRALYDQIDDIGQHNLQSFDIASYEESIDDFQSKIQSLGDTLSSIHSGSFSDADLTDLLQEFPELEGETENLEQAIHDLIYSSLTALYDTLGEEVPDSLRRSLQETADLASGASVKLTDAFSAIHDSWQILHDFKDVMAAGFDDNVTDDLLQSVRGLSGELENLVAGYYSGVVSAEQLYSALTQHYETDLQNYGHALVAKNQLSDDFYNNVGMTSQEVVDQFAEDYSVDLKNCKNYAQAKIAIEQQTLGAIGAAWSKYYDAQARTFTNLGGGRSELEARASHGGGGAKEILNAIDNYESAMKKLDEITYNGIEANFDRISTGINNASDSAASGASAAESAADDFLETLDWIETAIDRVERAISTLGSRAENVFSSWSDRNSALVGELGAVRQEIELQQAGYQRYLQEANSVGLSEEWAEKVRNGQVNIEDITDEGLSDKISEYQEWYEKALDCNDAIEDLSKTVSELYKQAFDNVSAQYDAILSFVENSKSLIDESISQTEERGYLVSAQYYEALMQTERTNISYMQKEREALLSSLNDAVSSGAIKEGSEEWADMRQQIDDVTLSIEEANTAMIQYSNSIRDLQWKIFDLLQEKISSITSEADFLVDLLDSKKLYSDNGEFTDEAKSIVGLHGVNYDTYMQQADRYAQEMMRINQELAQDPYNQDLEERRRSLLELQQESIIAAEDEKQAIIDMVEEGINVHLEALQELIDSYDEALDAQKSLYDYQKNMAELTKNRADIEKQLMSMQGDTSEEGRLRLQELQNQLKEANDEIEETEYDKYISDQKELLDNLYDEYSETLNRRLDDVDGLMVDMISYINGNAADIRGTLVQTTDSVGYMLSDTMTSIWDTSTGQITSVVEMYGGGLLGGLSNIDTTVESAIQGIEITNSRLADINSTVAASIGTITGSLQAVLSKLELQSALASLPSVGTSSAATATAQANPNAASPASANSSAVPASGQDGFFIYSKDNYPKSQLNINSSIIDRLKYRDYDSSFNARKMYYSKMGFSGTYTGSNTQNARMLDWMRLHGYKNGVFNLKQDELAWTQEGGMPETIVRKDGSVLTPLRQGDSVLNADATKNLMNLVSNPPEFIQKWIKDVPSSQNISRDNIVNNISLAFPNVTDYRSFKYELQHDPNIEKIIQEMVVGKATGRNSLNKYRY